MTLSFYTNIITFPRSLQRDEALSWELIGRTISGGKTFAGFMPVARVDGGGLWSATLGNVRVSSADNVRAWHALTALLDSGAAPVVLEKRDERLAPWPLVGGVPLTDVDTPHSDDAPLDDEAEYEGSVINVTLAAAGALRATSLTLEITTGEPLRGGEHFSIQHETHSHRLYRIGSVSINDDGNSVVTIRPPLREATDSGTRCEFDYPKCVMRLASADAMDLSLERRFHGSATVKFIEEFPPFNL